MRILFGLPFLLFIPGYSLVSALWVKKAELGGLERASLSLGLSIVVVPLAGLGLNYTPWGITLTSVVITLYCLIFLFVVVAWLRRSKLSTEERFVVNTNFFLDPIKTISPHDKLMVLIVGILLIVGVGILSYMATHPPQERYTELFLLDANGSTDNYPSNLDVNENTSIIIGVVCHENKITSYNTAISLVPVNGTNITLAEYSFSLDDDEEWRQIFNFSVNETGKYMLLVEIFKDNITSPYSSNHIWIDVNI
jgi:uncharacterized membrane protein